MPFDITLDGKMVVDDNELERRADLEALRDGLRDIPLVGDILTGGKGQGIIGVTFALGGTIDKPMFQANPASALAPGFLRRFFDYGGTGTAPTPPKSKDG